MFHLNLESVLLPFLADFRAFYPIWETYHVQSS
jgi:hypothetical protein